MKKVLMGLIALVMCLSSFKGIAQNSLSVITDEMVNDQMVSLVTAAKENFQNDMSKEEFTKIADIGEKFLEMEEGNALLDQVFADCKNNVQEEEIRNRDNSVLKKVFLRFILLANTNEQLNEVSFSFAKMTFYQPKKKTWFQKAVSFLVHIFTTAVTNNNPNLKPIMDTTAKYADTLIYHNK